MQNHKESVWIICILLTGVQLFILFKIHARDVEKPLRTFGLWTEMLTRHCGSLIWYGYVSNLLLPRNVWINLVSFLPAVINSPSKWRSIALQTRILSLQPTFPLRLGSPGVIRVPCFLAFLHPKRCVQHSSKRADFADVENDLSQVLVRADDVNLFG
jgi:hypothetical protein